jgi:penicillin-binding protein 1A
MVKSAFLAAEDKNFYEHGGLDFTGIARAAVLYVQSYGSNRRPQGASTITQQVAKNFLLTNEVSIRAQDQGGAARAPDRARLFQGKILELYLNEIYLGLGAYGVAAARCSISTSRCTN